MVKWTPQIKKKWLEQRKQKRNLEREKLIKEKWKRIKTEEFKSEEEKLMFENLGKSKTGLFLRTKIGLKNVYKNSPLVKDGGKFYKSTAEINKKDTLEGFKMLKEQGIPVTEFKGIKKIRGKEYLVFEKARNLTKREINEKLNEIIDIIEKASKKGYLIDCGINNFGINKKRQLVIRDTNCVGPGKQWKLTKKEVHRQNLKKMEFSLLIDIASPKIKENFENIKKKRGLP